MSQRSAQAPIPPWLLRALAEVLQVLEWLGEKRLIACWQFEELPGRHFHLCLRRWLRWLGPVIRPLLYGALFTEEGDEGEPH